MNSIVNRLKTRRGVFRRLLATCLAATAISAAACTETVVTCNGGNGRPAANCLGFRLGSAPTVDGDPTEPAWIPSFRYQLGESNGVSVPDAVVQGMRTSDSIYLSFEVNNDPTFDLDDAIVLAFDPDGTAADQRRIHIYPVFPAGAAANGVPQQVSYWKDSTGWPNATPVNPTPNWLLDNIRVTSQDSGTSKHWRVEIRIPVVAGPNDPGINLPNNDDFGFYFSVLVAQTVSGVTNYVAEKSWPIGVNVGAFIENTPAASTWGNGILGRVANGVSVQAITTDQPDPYQISLNLPNTFRADVRNDMVDSAGTAAIAKNVRASFRLANWGIAGANPWDLIPTGNNPTPLHDVPAAGTYQFATQPWTVSAADKPKYQATPHQCVQVDLETTGPDTLIVNRRLQANMDFVDTHSPFSQKAAIGTAGFKPPEGQRELEFLLREFRYNTKAEAPWKTELTGAQPVADRLYRVRTGPGPDVTLATTITPPEIRIPLERIQVRPGPPNQAARLAVRPGSIITFVANGSLTRGDLTVGPNGTDPRVAHPQDSARAVDKGFPLPAADSPETRIGALIGSFDGFSRGAFVIGRATTIAVPEGAEVLTLGINDTKEGWAQQKGGGYTVEAIQTPTDDVYRFTSSLVRKPGRDVVKLALGQNLPTWIMCGERRLGSTLNIRGRVYDRYERTGCFGYAVKSIASGAPAQPAPGAAQATTPGAAAPAGRGPGL